MVNRDFHQRRIERPSGRPGYRPTFWCAVCGKKALPNTDRKCTTENCPNLCHENCLGGEEEYNCEHTGLLRAEARIDDPVTFYNQEVDPIPDTSQAPLEEEDDQVGNLSRDELVLTVRSLWKELTSTKEQLNTFKHIIENLPEKRSVLVEALSIVDTLLATQASVGEVQPTSVACTAKPEKIDSEWNNFIEESDETYIWWASVQNSERRGRNRRHSPSLPESFPRSQPPHHHQDEETRQQRVVKRGNNRTAPIQEPVYSLQPQTQNRHLGEERRQQPPRNRNRNKKSAGQPREIPYNREVEEQRQGRVELGRKAQEQQVKCSNCHRTGHSQDQCPRHVVCEYCQGRSHSAQNCRERLADQRQQELIQAIRKSSQEAFTASRGAVWHLPPTGQQGWAPQTFHNSNPHHIHNLHHIQHPHWTHTPPFTATSHNNANMWQNHSPQPY